MNKRTLKTTAFFSALVFLILMVTRFLNVFLTIILFRAGILESQPREFTLIVFAIVSIFVGMIFSKFAARRSIGTIIEISEATKKIAEGNFDVSLNENIRAAELQTMAHNFNLMARELLSQVWQNLLGNAIKFISENGRIRVLLRQKQTGIEVSIVDNGPGMSEEVKERIYEKFYQGDVSHTSAGNGLGLTLAKRIIDLHKGSIIVSSKVGKSTAFKVILPDN